jgi:hypothetical protein
MYVGAMLKGTKVGGYIAGNLLEPLSLKKRHDDLAAEMVRRGYNHQSSMGDNTVAAALASLPDYQLTATVDLIAASEELFSRCSVCRGMKEKTCA